MQLTGELFIAGERVATDESFAAVNPATDGVLPTRFSVAGSDHIARAAREADNAFDDYRNRSLEDRARFLEQIAENIENLGPPLIERAQAESGLPQARLEGERGRTCGQLRLFAKVVRAGDWLNLRIDPPMPDRSPAPRSDLRQRKIAVGPVAVFGASNFPLAFSVAGGDTASALAAGCPVIVKGHPNHPGTGELVGRAIADAAAQAGMPAGVFSLLNGHVDTGMALVRDHRIKAVGFTGSREAGLAIVEAANGRAEPIPVYAEMSSINPVILMPGALAVRANELAHEYVASLTMGAGQFCTNPGIIFAIEGNDLDVFCAASAKLVSQFEPTTMLSSGIGECYRNALASTAARPGIEQLACGTENPGTNAPPAAIFAVSADQFRGDLQLREEMFGAAGIIVRCTDLEDMLEAVASLDGQLTATLQLEPGDHGDAATFIPLLERKAGRILANGWPTGVEVSHAMVHGGPFPATSDPRTTSVGTLAIERFLRPVCYQDLPASLLPTALKDDNPYDAPRLVDGVWER